MKIKLLFQRNSVSKTVIDASILVLMIFIVHFIFQCNLFTSYLGDNKAISHLTNSLIYLNRLELRSPSMKDNITEIDKNLSAEQLQQSWFNTESINTKNSLTLKQWSLLKQRLQSHAMASEENSLQQFSNSLSTLIKEYKILAEKKTQLIYLIELGYFLFLLLNIIFIIYYCKRHIALPINRLVKQVKADKSDQITRTLFSSANELNQLSQSVQYLLQNSCSSLDQMQAQILEKTIALEKANQTIEFLFSTSQQLSVVNLSSPILTEALNALGKYAQLQRLCLELNNGHFIPSELGCATVVKGHLRIPIIINSKPYGYLNYVANNNTQEQHDLIESFTGLVARALYQQEHSTQEQKLLLMEERAIIARELHDSIAQSLSFLKIQCDLLHRQINNDQKSSAQKSIDDIKTAVNDAYKHLRSLLATFRLNAPQSNFNEALQTVINTLQTHTKAKISISHFPAPFNIDASQHIHLLQIIREAIINAIKHANCSHIDISCIITGDNNVWISITDNGDGITNKSIQLEDEHYGLSIMQQRADELGATLSLPPHSRGTEVKIIFPLTACYSIKE